MVGETVIPEEQAREILTRAAEIDRRAAEAIPVETLRAAAREAGIAAASFEAALGEHTRATARGRATLVRRHLLVGTLAGVGGAGLLLVGLALLLRLVP